MGGTNLGARRANKEAGGHTSLRRSEDSARRDAVWYNPIVAPKRGDNGTRQRQRSHWLTARIQLGK